MLRFCRHLREHFSSLLFSCGCVRMISIMFFCLFGSCCWLSLFYLASVLRLFLFRLGFSFLIFGSSPSLLLSLLVLLVVISCPSPFSFFWDTFSSSFFLVFCSSFSFLSLRRFCAHCYIFFLCVYVFPFS